MFNRLSRHSAYVNYARIAPALTAHASAKDKSINIASVDNTKKLALTYVFFEPTRILGTIDR